ncbi:MAG TPA: sigma-70 family RNA polymerase sigma factor [Myxococcota bacterium]|nr:sigma-70 family RNA polymerase sigma factor [Myxococcota bacterium]
MSALMPTLSSHSPVALRPTARVRPIYRPAQRLQVPTLKPVEASPEARLLDRLRAGDEEAYEELVRANGGRMLAVARRLLSSEEDARDVVQDAFLLAFRALPQFEGGCRLSTWLHRIVVNAALMKLRSRRRHPEGSIEELLPRFETDGHRIPGDVPERDPEDVKLERDQLSQVVRGCIAQLPERYRTVLVLRDIEELSTEEACELLGLSRDAVKTRLHRARQALRSHLQDEFVTHA